MLRLLCITAHPDDEAGGFGGSLAHYAARGVETHVICLTPGQAARNRGGAKSDEELAAMRRQEFEASCRILNVSRGVVLDYRDGALDRADFHAAAGDLVNRIRRIKPHVVLTFGPEGAITGHPDHSMASILATVATHWAGRNNRYPEQLGNGLAPHQAQKLYYATTLFTLPDRQPVSLPPSTAVIDVAPYIEAKINAFRQHKSQAPLFPYFERTIQQRENVERFHLAANSTPKPVEMETDLMAGVRED